MKITILSKAPVKTQFNNVLSEKPVLNDDSDVVIVYSDDYFTDQLFDYLKRLKKKYLAVFVIGFNDPELLLYNKQYVEFCFDNNINFLDFDKDTSELISYLDKNLSFDADYTKFAKYYLELQPDIDYTPWFRGCDFSGKKIVDLGCGMPTYLSQLNPREYHGIDLSEEMIKRAKQSFPSYKFETGDICNANYTADVVISILDVFNYLPEFEDVKAVITNVFLNLNSGGEFIFDVHDKAVLRTFKDYFDFEDNGDEQFIWESNVAKHNLTHYFQIVDKEYKVYVEKHYQHYYDIDLILKHMEAVGFTSIEVEREYNHHIVRARKEESNE